MIKIYKKGENKTLTENFRSSEFDCHGKGCCSSTLIDTELVEILQKIRDHFGAPVKITSGYRCEKHNKSVGGVSGSKHRYGMAADIKADGILPKEVALFAESIGVKGIGLYETDYDGYFIHVDTRSEKSFWYGQTEQYRSTFEEKKVNRTVLEWQKAAIADGFSFKSDTDGVFGAQCEAVAKKAICKKRLIYKYRNLTKIIQHKVCVKVDGKFGSATKRAVVEWQKSKGLKQDGIVGLNSWKVMLEV